MSDAGNVAEVSFIEGETGIAVAGDLNESNAGAFAAEARDLSVSADSSITLNMSGLDIDDGIALTTCVNVLRELRARVSKVVIQGAPQILGHNLYRVGMLGGPRGIELFDMRLDEPSGF